MRWHLGDPANIIQQQVMVMVILNTFMVYAHYVHIYTQKLMTFIMNKKKSSVCSIKHSS